MSQINFPNSPEDGDKFLAGNGTTYQYDSATGQWKIVAGPGVQGPPGSSASIPTGMVMPFVGSTAPTDWLECDGSSIPSQYTDLIALVGANVPDFRGEFIRGWDNGRGVDSGRTLGSTQTEDYLGHSHSSASVSNHTHTINAAGAHTHTYSRQGSTPASGSNKSVASTSTSNQTSSSAGSHAHSMNGAGGHNHTIGNSGGSETRPRNVALMYCIKT